MNEKKSLKRGRKKICLRCLLKIYSFLTENISLRIFYGDQMQPLRRDFVLLSYI